MPSTVSPPGNIIIADDLPPISAVLMALRIRVIAHDNGNGVSMKDASAATAKKTSQNQRKLRKSADENTALHRRYGQIGISAVAAAVRYQGSGKNLAYAPVASKWQDHATA